MKSRFLNVVAMDNDQMAIQPIHHSFSFLLQNDINLESILCTWVKMVSLSHNAGRTIFPGNASLYALFSSVIGRGRAVCVEQCYGCREGNSASFWYSFVSLYCSFINLVRV